MPRTRFASVDDYLDAQPEATRQVLERVRAAIRKALPKAEEAISYNIPAYKIGGRTAIYFAGFTKHYSLYPVSDALKAELGDAIAPYVASKGTLRFPLTEVPAGLIQKIAKSKAREAAARGK